MTFNFAWIVTKPGGQRERSARIRVDMYVTGLHVSKGIAEHAVEVAGLDAELEVLLDVIEATTAGQAEAATRRLLANQGEVGTQVWEQIDNDAVEAAAAARALELFPDLARPLPPPPRYGLA